jgi:hypothetical protein
VAALFAWIRGGSGCIASSVEPETLAVDEDWFSGGGLVQRRLGILVVDGEGGLRSKVWHKYSGVSDDKIGSWRPSVIKIKAVVSNYAASVVIQ